MLAAASAHKSRPSHCQPSDASSPALRRRRRNWSKVHVYTRGSPLQQPALFFGILPRAAVLRISAKFIQGQEEGGLSPPPPATPRMRGTRTGSPFVWAGGHPPPSARSCGQSPLPPCHVPASCSAAGWPPLLRCACKWTFCWQLLGFLKAKSRCCSHSGCLEGAP